MNAVEIESAISDLASQPFNSKEFPFLFLEAYDNKATTLAKLRGGATNKSDIEGGVLQRNNIHILVTELGKVDAGLLLLKLSQATTKYKCEFVLATDGRTFEAEHLPSGECVICEYEKFPDYFGFFLPLAGISTVQSIRENSFDIKAIGRLNRLYLELLRENPEWKEGELRHEMNRFLVRLIFCFYAEDTNIFSGSQLFSSTIAQMTDRSSSNTHEVIAEIFRAMTLNDELRKSTDPLPRWAARFPYVNGGLFSNATLVPRFSQVARSYLIQIGNLNWKEVNPDIFGSMIQGVALDSERSDLGMHYTSVPNILKVLNPLLLDELRAQLEAAQGNPRKLLNLRRRLSKIRVFDPACGSGNFLLIAYKQLRAIEYEINVQRGESNIPSEIPLTNFRGIELQDFAAEVARLSLVIAEFQCNALYRGASVALSMFLPLARKNWIVSGNALLLDWKRICPTEGTSVQVASDNLFGTSTEAYEVGFDNNGGEVYICGNPPFKGKKDQTESQKSDLQNVASHTVKNWKSLDYVCGWFLKAKEYILDSRKTKAAFVSTNSIVHGKLPEILWPSIFGAGVEIFFAVKDFPWFNLATKKAVVSVVIVGLRYTSSGEKWIYSEDQERNLSRKEVDHINGFLSTEDAVVSSSSFSICGLPKMRFGNMAYDGKQAFLRLNRDEFYALISEYPEAKQLCRPFLGTDEFISGLSKYCLWISNDEKLEIANSIPMIKERLDHIRELRENSTASARLKSSPHLMREMYESTKQTLIVGRVTSANRSVLPADLISPNIIVGDRAFAIYDAPTWTFGLISSRLHWVWVNNVCGKRKGDFNYSNTLGWNTFPVPKLTEKNKNDLIQSSIRILEIREGYFPATIAELYDNQSMPEDLRKAHEYNDEIVERIFIGRKFKNDSERLEKLYVMYADLIAKTDKDSKND